MSDPFDFSRFDPTDASMFTGETGWTDSSVPEAMANPEPEMESAPASMDETTPVAPIQAISGAGWQVAVVDDDAAVLDYMADLVDGEVVRARSVGDLEHGLGISPVVVVLGPSCAADSELAVVERWVRDYPNVVTLLVTAELTTQLLHRALRSGVKDVLAAPVTSEQVNEAVGRVATMLPPDQPAPSAAGTEQAPSAEADGKNRVISVFSTKGGSGKSVTATNLAVTLARRSSKPVVLLDGHLQFGDVAVMLKLRPQHTVADAIAQLDQMDTSLIERLMTRHEPSGLYVLPAPLEPTYVDQVTVDQLRRLLDCLKAFAGTVIIDLPAIFNEFVLSVLEESDDIILVTGLDVPNIKNVKIGMSTLELLNIPKERLHLVLNRSDSKVKLNVSEVERTLGSPAAAHIPSDVAVPISVNKGAPVVLSAAKSGPARAFEELADRFDDQPPIRTEAPQGLWKIFS